KLYFHHRTQPVCAHAYSRAHDTAFGNGRIENTIAPIFGLQAFRAAENAAEIANVLPKNYHIVVTPEHDIHGGAQRLNHGHGSRLITACLAHDHTPACWRWRRRCQGMSLYTSSNMVATLLAWPLASVPCASACFWAATTSASISFCTCLCSS